MTLSPRILYPAVFRSCSRLKSKHLIGYEKVIYSRGCTTATATATSLFPNNNFYTHYAVPARQSARRQQQIRPYFWSSNDSNDKEKVDPLVEQQQDANSFQPSTFSLGQVISKQRDEDLSAHELSLKMALQQHTALIDNPSSPTESIKNSLENLRDCFEVLEFWEESLNVEQELESYSGTALELADCIFRQGKLYMRVGDAIHGSEKYQKALEMFQMEHGVIFHADIGNVLVAIAGVHFHRENPDECMRVLDEAENHFRKHGISLDDTNESTQDPHPDLVKCLDNQGMIYRLREDFNSALEKFEEALALVDKSDNAKRLSLQMHIADMFSALDDIDSGIYYYQKILKEDKGRRKSDEETELDAVIWHSIGLLHSQQREFQLADEELTRALELKKRFGGETNPDVASTLNALGSVNGVMGNKRKALECFQEALLIERMHAEDENEPQILHILRNISVLKGEKVPKWDG